MKKLLGSICLTTLATLATSTAYAGGLDRSGQDITLLFESGNVVKFSAAYIDPNITSAAGGISDAGTAYTQFSLGYKQQLNEKLSFAVIYDQPYGAAISYVDGPVGIAGLTALVTSHAVTGLARYQLGNGFALHAGVRAQQVSADVNAFALDVTSDWGFGGVVGVSWEKPEIAARVAITYNSEVSQTFTGSETIPYTTPQSVNLDFQTGIAANTLVFGSIRWVNWNGFNITGGRTYINYTQDVTTYTIGVGRKFSDTLSGAISIGYEAPSGIPSATPLAPTDGYISLGIGGTYTLDSGTKITGGLRYVWLGDQNAAGIPFANNYTIAAGISVLHEF